MELIASVSRSSGLEKDGDALRDFKVQEEYRAFIEDKLQDYWKQYRDDANKVASKKQREDVEGNLLILFRKLREGLLSTKRTDTFALEVYETSLHLSILFNSPGQTTSIITHLLPHLYSSFTELPSTTRSTALLSLLHCLVSGYPSQSRFFEHMATLPDAFVPKKSEQGRWIAALACSLRTRNYTRLYNLTENKTLVTLLPQSLPDCPPKSEVTHTLSQDNSSNGPRHLARDALFTLIDNLRSKARNTTSLVLRSAYRELHCDISSKGTTGTVSPTCHWLCRSLALPSVSPEYVDDDTVVFLIDKWLQEKRAAEEIRPKEGVEGRWILCKVKA
ncbi:unnamed protein product [Somion occarium]